MSNARTVFVTCALSSDGALRMYKVHVGRLGEFPTGDRFASFPPFDNGYAFFEAEKLTHGRGWRFARMIPLREVSLALRQSYAAEMQRVDKCRTRGPAPDPQATDW
jgi:hypothetical protein